MSNAPVIFDLETRSEKDLREVGGRLYAKHPTTQIVSLVALIDGVYHTWIPTYLWPTSPPILDPKLMVPYDYGITDDQVKFHYQAEFPEPIAAACADRTFIGHNAFDFDSHVWREKLPVVPKKWDDSMFSARAAGLPGSLDAIGKLLFGRGKDIGGKLMNKICTMSRKLAHSCPCGRKCKIDTTKAGKPVKCPACKGISTVRPAPSEAEVIVEYQPVEPGYLQAFIRYNIADVAITKRLWDRVECYGEEDVIQVHQAVNERGVMLDHKLVNHLVRLETQGKRQQNELVAMVTDEALSDTSSTQKVHKWLKSQGVVIPNMQRKFIEQLLADPQGVLDQAEALPDPVLQVLQARLACSKISAPKLLRAVAVADPVSHRIQDLHVYYGAHTGRWSSHRLQTHNLPKGLAKFDVPKAIEAYLAGTLSAATPDEISTLIRPCLVAAPGHVFVIIDYAAVECRGVAWAANEQPLLDAFAADGDVYCQMASKLYGREITKKDKTERNLGKVIVLGCLAEGTPVLTDTGWKPIEAVAATDRVWDGEEWVSHDGVVFQGEKNCVEVARVWLTPDHEVLTTEGWKEAWSLIENIPSLHLGQYSENGRLLMSSSVNAVEFSTSFADAHVGVEPQSFATISSQESPEPATLVQSGGRLGRERLNQAMQQSCPIIPIGSDCSIVSPLSWAAAQTKRQPVMRTMAVEESASISLGSRIVESFWHILSRFLAGTTQTWKSIASITTDTTSQATCGSQLASSRLKTGDRTEKRRTYDILNAGPRRRFQAGPLIAHNCGYGMGAPKFALSCKMQGVDLAAAGVTAEQCVEGYRAAYPNIAGHPNGLFNGRVSRRNGVWQQYSSACMDAVRDGLSIEAGKCRFVMEGRDLHAILPSGRPLVYRNARIEKQVPQYALLLGLEMEPKDTVVYDSPRGHPSSLYGGKITENMVQAMCRDLLATALVFCEYAGMRPVLHVHDEIVCEVPEVQVEECLRRVAMIMSSPPAWAAGFPVKVEGFAAPRYVKAAWPGYPEIVAINGSVK